jgi:hypothetical protein
MKKVNNQYIDRLVKKFINENINDKADKIMSQINELGGMDDGHPRFGEINFAKLSDKELEDLLKQPMDNVQVDFNDDSDEEPLYEIDMDGSEVCECGSNTMVSEGMCMECGLPKMEEGIYDEDDLDDSNEFDYIEEMDDIDFDFEEERDEEKDNESEKTSEMDEFCKYQLKSFGPKDERYLEKCSGKSAIKDLSSMKMNMNEKLHGRQKNIDKNHNNRIDAEDFRMLRKGETKESHSLKDASQDEFSYLEEFCSYPQNMFTRECEEYFKYTSKYDDNDFKEENKEGNAFTGALANAKKHHKDEFNVDGKKFHVKESVKLTEAELIDLIENLVNEKEIKGLKNFAKPKGMAEYERAYKGSGRENKDAISATNKKMKEYVKYGSEGEYDSEPKDFPMSNGQIKHKNIKGFNMDDEGTNFIKSYLQPGQEDISYDEMHPNEEQIKNNIEGSSKTGNSDEYANSVKTDVNKNLLKKQKARKLDILSKKAANKDPQPTFATKSKSPGYSDGDGVRVTNESNNPKEERILNEEFNRIAELMKYNRSTQ